MSQKTGSSRSGAPDAVGFRFILGWYADQCDGEWEHEFGIKIETIDNPGWSVRVDLVDTDVYGRSLEFSRRELPDREWVMAASDGERFTGASSPGAASEIDRAFEKFVLNREWPGRDEDK